jgi:hypothetical protein
MALRTVITPTKVSVFEPSGTDGNDPFRDPTSYVRNIIFDGRFGYYQVEIAADAAVSHLAVAADPGASFTGTSPANLGYLVYNLRVTKSFVLLTHNLGLIPRVKVSDVNNALLSPARPIQKATGSGLWTAYRTVRIRVTTTQVILDEIAIPGPIGLSALSTTYHVRVFSTIGPVAGQPGFLARPSAVEMAQGAVDSTKRSLRVAKTGETHMVKPVGRASDIKNGQFRFVAANGTVYDTDMVTGSASDPYNGSFAGPTLVPVVL